MVRYSYPLLLPFLMLTIGAFPGASGENLKVCLVSGSEEYESDVSLPKFKEYLEERYNAECVLIKAIGFEEP